MGEPCLWRRVMLSKSFSLLPVDYVVKKSTFFTPFLSLISPSSEYRKKNLDDVSQLTSFTYIRLTGLVAWVVQAIFHTARITGTSCYGLYVDIEVVHT
ncbi:hypothetical protein AVEN_93718-1 [Araneus ventricosus]|uniref:Uncharacterized protein n=1 Tax=Araneus ventricosus TaxID=182803 RepID=A0A4Y2WXI7_ARAVE|nr:hypothetical protein AVEN_93718-1 [Araneus ventricosus]